MSEEFHRSFMGIFPPKEIIERISFLQNNIKKFAPHAKWEHESKFHITLQFLGDKSAEWLTTFHQTLITSLADSPFTIILSEIGCFPNIHSPKIFWIGSTPEENIPLVKLANVITEISKQNGHEPDKKPFHPHITIGRGKGKINPDLIQNIETVTFHPLEFRCTELCIMKSMLAQSGSTYTTLFTIPLK